jgi:hypothetical protein
LDVFSVLKAEEPSCGPELGWQGAIATPNKEKMFASQQPMVSRS